MVDGLRSHPSSKTVGVSSSPLSVIRPSSSSFKILWLWPTVGCGLERASILSDTTHNKHLHPSIPDIVGLLFVVVVYRSRFRYLGHEYWSKLVYYPKLKRNRAQPETKRELTAITRPVTQCQGTTTI